MTTAVADVQVSVQSKSARIRELYLSGMKVGPISKEVGVSYQRAYNTVQAMKVKEVLTPTPPESTGDEPMEQSEG